MATTHFQTSYSSYLVFGLLVFVFAWIATSATAQSTSRLVSDLCKTTSDPTFCLKALGSDPRSATVSNLEKLLPIAIDSAISEATKTRVKIAALLKNTKIDPNTKVDLEICDMYYDQSVSKLQEAISELPEHHYRDLKFHVGAASLAPEDCENSFKVNPSPSPLTENNHNFGISMEILSKILIKF